MLTKPFFFSVIESCSLHLQFVTLDTAIISNQLTKFENTHIVPPYCSRTCRNPLDYFAACLVAGLQPLFSQSLLNNSN